MEGALSLVGKPVPQMGNVDQLSMSRALNSWRRNQMSDPAFSRAFRMYNHPTNAGMVSRVGAPLTRVKPLVTGVNVLKSMAKAI